MIRSQPVYSPSLERFAKAYAQGEPQVVWTRLVDDLETPVSAFLKLGQRKKYSCLFESVEGGSWRGRYSILTLDPDLVWRARGAMAEIAEEDGVAADVFVACPDDALTSLRRLVEEAAIELPGELPPMAAGLFGVLGYDTVRLVERLGPSPPDTLGLPDAVMTRPRIVAIFDGVSQEIVLVTPVRARGEQGAETAYAEACRRLEQVSHDLARPLPRPVALRRPTETADLRSALDRTAYCERVAAAKAYIEAGDIFQVVPSRRLSAPYTGDPFAFYRALRRLNPSPYLYFLDFGDFQLAGSSPEILVRWRDGRVTLRPIAGTRPRGETPQADARNEIDLLADPKERAEHLMLLDLGRNDVARAIRLGEPDAAADPQAQVVVTESFVVERYSHVMHIVSNVEGRTTRRLDPVDVILASLPAGTLSGAPKVRAMQIIDELEPEKRGVGYGGAAGYISAGGVVDTCIVLRTGLFTNGRLHVQAGGGVVADSDPDAEFDETSHKAQALERALAEAWRFEA